MSVVLLTIGLIWKIAPPKKINSIFGYRTSLSMSNSDLWNLGNKVSSNVLITGAICLVLINILSFFVEIDKKFLTAIYLFCVLVVFVLIFSITENRLRARLKKKN